MHLESRRRGLPAWFAAAAVMAAPAALYARGIPYGAVSDAALVRCDELEWRGARTESKACYEALAKSTGATASVRAEAAWALGDAQRANEWFRQAAAAAPGDSRVRTRWADLYVETHQDAQALQLYEEALKLDPANAFAKVGAGSLLAGQFSTEADQYLDAVLKDANAPAGARLRALLLAATVALENGDSAAGAAALIEQAAALATQSRLPLLEVNALRAAQDELAGRSPSPWIAATLQLDPAWGGIYAVPAHFYEMRRRANEALALYRKAVELQPDLWSARVSLGSALLRENRLTEARAQFEAAYRGDPFDPRTTNTLRLLDSLAQSVVVTYPPLGAAGGSQPKLLLRMNRQESPVLAGYAQQLALQAIDTYSKRYRFELKQPVMIEIYKDHEDFAVRTAGMPGLGLLGVTFGYVLAIDSPEARAVNEFHWGSTLWHEMAHVFTLESTNHRVPRWFSEGLSVFEEWRTGPVKGIDIPGYVFADLRDGKALPVADLDRGFIRPDYAEQVQVSYMQAGLICDYIERTAGFDQLVALLDQYRRGADTPTAFRAVLGTSTEDFDARFRADMKQRYRAVFEQYPAWRSERAAAVKAAAAQDWSAALTHAHAALAILPQDVEGDSPWLPLAAALQATQHASEARQALYDYWQRGGHDPGALKTLAAQFHAANQPQQALQVLQSVNYVAPFDAGLHGELGDWLLELQRPAEALAEYGIAAALDAPDKAELHLRLAKAHQALGERAQAHSEVLQSLEIAPNFRPAQQLLLELSKNP